MGVMFSQDPSVARKFTSDETDVIDGFFDSLRWDITDREPVVPVVTAGTLLHLFDMENRWTYEGSLTTPPCTTSIQWNVLTTVYPIKDYHVQEFRNQMGRQKEYNLTETGNYRVT